MSVYNKKGGKFRFCVIGAKDNNTFVVPKGCKIDAITCEKLDNTSVNLAIGTTDGGTDIVDTVAKNSTALTACTVVDGLYSTTADQTIYITLSAAVRMNLFIECSKYN